MIDKFLIWLYCVGESAKRRLLNFLICLDQLVFSIITLGSSAPDETMSAAAWRLERERRLAGYVFRPLIDLLFLFDPDHCENAYKAEVAGFQRKVLHDNPPST